MVLFLGILTYAIQDIEVLKADKKLAKKLEKIEKEGLEAAKTQHVQERSSSIVHVIITIMAYFVFDFLDFNLFSYQLCLYNDRLDYCTYLCAIMVFILPISCT